MTFPHPGGSFDLHDPALAGQNVLKDLIKLRDFVLAPYKGLVDEQSGRGQQ
jgi:hypothetical protein